MKKIVAWSYLISIYGTLILALMIKIRIVNITYFNAFLIMAIGYFITLIGDIYIILFMNFESWNIKDRKKHILQTISGGLLFLFFLFYVVFCTVIDPEWGAEIASF